MNAGELVTFPENLPHLLSWASFLIQSDEIEKAEWLLFHGLPGYYRDHPPVEVLEMRKKLYRFLMNVSDYAMNREDNTLCDPKQALSNMHNLLRGKLLAASVKKLNDENLIPHIYDMGPGEYWLPIGLKELGLRFTYQCAYLSQTAYDKQKLQFEEYCRATPPEGSPHLFVATEIIEHLRSVYEIPHCMHKYAIDPIQIHLSTPLNTFSQGCSGPWDSEANLGRGGHLRTYTAYEFIEVARHLFPGYDWDYYPGSVQSIVGFKHGTSR